MLFSLQQREVLDTIEVFQLLQYLGSVIHDSTPLDDITEVLLTREDNLKQLLILQE